MITITIATDNAAFSGGDFGWEVGRILRDLADRFEDGAIPAVVMDVNGNRVGSIEVTS